MMARLAIAAAMLAAAGTACGSYGTAEPTAPASADAGTTDGGGPTGATDGGAGVDVGDAGDPSAGAFFFDGFETVETCGRFLPKLGTPSAVSVADRPRSGARVCRLCSSGPVDAFIETSVMPKEAGSFVLSFYTRASPTTPARYWAGYLEMYTPDGGTIDDHYTTGPVVDGWTRAQLEVSGAGPIASMLVEIGLEAEDDGKPRCVDLDDVRIDHTP